MLREIVLFNINENSFENMGSYKEHQTSITAIDCNDHFILSGDTKRDVFYEQI